MVGGLLMVLDDILTMTKTAASKTVGVLGDDLALNAEQVSGVKPNRELPVVWGVFKGSLINKLILVPAALLISVFAPWLMIPLLMVGGAFLCFEGVENLKEKFFNKEKVQAHQEQHLANLELSKEEMLKQEKKKIKGAVRTDFILSAEIIVISLNAINAYPLFQKIIALSILGVGFTVFVYGIVALIVKLDDIGFWLDSKKAAVVKLIGRGFINVVPWLMKALSLIGLVAMFLVGGGIIVHGLHPVAEFITHISPAGWTGALVSMCGNAVVALVVGIVIVLIHDLVLKMMGRESH